MRTLPSYLDNTWQIYDTQRRSLDGAWHPGKRRVTVLSPPCPPQACHSWRRALSDVLCVIEHAHLLGRKKTGFSEEEIY